MRKINPLDWLTPRFIYKHFPIYWGIIVVLSYILIIIKKPSEAYFYLIFIALYGPFGLLVNPKVLLFNNNIIFMSIFTFLIIPFVLSIWLAYLLFTQSENNFFAIVIGIAGVSVILFSLKLALCKSTEFLENVKISFDIIRLFFVIVLTVSAISTRFMDDFSIFRSIILIKPDNIDEMRKIVDTLIQIATFPFILTSTGLKTFADFLLLQKKRKKA